MQSKNLNLVHFDLIWPLDACYVREVWGIFDKLTKFDYFFTFQTLNIILNVGDTELHNCTNKHAHLSIFQVLNSHGHMMYILSISLAN